MCGRMQTNIYKYVEIKEINMKGLCKLYRILLLYKNTVHSRFLVDVLLFIKLFIEFLKN